MVKICLKKLIECMRRFISHKMAIIFIQKALLGTIFVFASFVPLLAEDNLYKAGVVFYMQAKYDKALEYFSEALKQNPDNIQAVYYFANSLVKTYKSDYAIKYYQRVIDMDPYSELADHSRKALKDIADYKAANREPKESLLMKGSKLYSSVNSYIQQVIEYGPIIHWDKAKMPRKVFIKPSKYKEYDRFAWQAFKNWQEASEGLVSFEKTEIENEANIIVNWDNTFYNSMEYDFFGYVIPKLDGDNLTQYNIYLVEHDYDGKIHLPTALLTYAMHQIGHSLGITSHSPIEDDIMYIDANKGKISRRDISTLHLLYQLKPDISNFNEPWAQENSEETEE